MDDLKFSSNFTLDDEVFKSIEKKTFVIDPPSLVNGEAGNIINNLDGSKDTEEENPNSPLAMMILIPLASLMVIIILAATIKWRHRFKAERGKAKDKSVPDNNNSAVTRVQECKIVDEVVPLKNRSYSTSSSNSTISRSILVEGGLPVTVSMRIVSEKEKIENSRTDLYCEINTKEKTGSKPDVRSVPSSLSNCDVLKEKVPETQISLTDEVANHQKSDLTVHCARATDSEKCSEIFPKRPKTLHVLAVTDQCDITNMNDAAHCPWSEQLWTPDAEIIEEDIYSPCIEHPADLAKEGQDLLCPLMGKGRFKMKPKGLLERRGSNVALTISLKNEEKSCTSPPPSSKSPKPLVYLRTASSKLDPVQLHVKSADIARLQQEFWEVPMNHPSEKHFSIPGYGTKNRYRSILPNPHSRVLLPTTPSGDPLSAYINANYISGYSTLSELERRRQSEGGKENEARRVSVKRRPTFIATQGPMANTIVDFWKMVWKEGSTAIVMITKLKERKEKCAEYIPMGLGEKQDYETFEVEVTNVRCADHFTIRTIQITNNEVNETRTISHFWYSEWLDHETPEKLRGLLKLVQEVELKCPDPTVGNAKQGPVIIHCSAGIGRTGCFIAISIGCIQLREEGKVDPLRIICQLRMDRGGMIQTWEQYQYVHVALSRYARLLAGENVSTPLTGSSTRTPDSRSSSFRSPTPRTPDVEKEVTSPQKQARDFSLKLHGRQELTPVTENNISRTPSSENVMKNGATDDVMNKSKTSSPRGSRLKSRFSFSCADKIINSTPRADNSTPTVDNSTPTVDNSTPRVENSTPERVNGVENGHEYNVKCNGKGDVPTPKGRVIPPQLSLKLKCKLSPVRDENWLINGHCEVQKEMEDPVSVKNSKDEKDFRPSEKLTSGRVNGVKSNDNNPQTPPLKTSTVTQEGGNKTNIVKHPKRAIFTFPSPEK